MILKDLQKLGFTKNLSTVYLALFELGEAKAGEIVRKTGLHRNLVYTALEKLEEKKLVMKIQTRGVARYKTLDPMQIMGEVDEKKRLAEHIIETLKTTHKVHSQEIIVYEGKEEMRRKYMELYSSLTSDDEWLIIGLSSGYFDVNGTKLVDEYMRLQRERGFRVKGISGYIDPQEDDYIEQTKGLTEFRLVPSISKKDNEIEILEDRVLIFIFTEPYTMVEIFNKDLVAGYREYFDLLWNTNVQTWSGDEGARYLLEDTLKYDDVYWIGGNGGIETYHKEVWEWYKPKRVNKKVMWHDLIDPGMQLSGLQEETTIFEDQYYEWKFLPETIASPHVMCVYGDKVANIVWKENSVINIIEDKEIAESYKKYHQYLWNQEVQTYSGWDEFETLYMQVLLPQMKSGDTEHVIGANLGIDEEAKSKASTFFARYNKARREKGIQMQALFYEKDREHARKQFEYSGDLDHGTAELRFLPNKYWGAMGVDIFPHHVVIFTLTEIPTATVYERETVVESFRKQFNAMWQQECKHM